MTDTFLCNRCNELKPGSDFYAYTYGSKLPRQPCKECHRSKRRNDYRENNGIDVSYAQVLKRDYGIGLDEYNALLRSQGNRCAICQRPETEITRKTGKVRRLAVDHDHATNSVRALLCKRCNLIVWAIEDNADRLSLVKRYVDQHRRAYRSGG